MSVHQKVIHRRYMKISSTGLFTKERKVARAKIQHAQKVMSWGMCFMPKNQAAVPDKASAITCAIGTVKTQNRSPVRSRLAGRFGTRTEINSRSSRIPFINPRRIIRAQLILFRVLLISRAAKINAYSAPTIDSTEDKTLDQSGLPR